MSETETAFVGIGSNLDGPVAQVEAATEALSRIPATRLLACSGLYGSTPMGPADQPEYVNAVAQVETGLDAHALLDALQGLETAAGRDRTVERWGPRTLDLDLLLYGDRVLADERLCLPHPGIGERAFVLVPLAEIAPELRPPGWRMTVGERAAEVDRSALWPLETPA